MLISLDSDEGKKRLANFGLNCKNKILFLFDCVAKIPFLSSLNIHFGRATRLGKFRGIFYVVREKSWRQKSWLWITREKLKRLKTLVHLAKLITTTELVKSKRKLFPSKFRNSETNERVIKDGFSSHEATSTFSPVMIATCYRPFLLTCASVLSWSTTKFAKTFSILLLFPCITFSCSCFHVSYSSQPLHLRF